jgi:ribonuclease HI
LIEERTGFAVHNNIDGKIEQRLQSPASVVSAEILAIKTAPDCVSEIYPGRYIIFTDSFSSLMALESRKVSCEAHSCILQCKQIYYDLQKSGYVTLSWVPVHVGIPGNEVANDEKFFKILYLENESSVHKLFTLYRISVVLL